ncbi:Gaa1-domain-containing protein [Russula earlei]|uniref:Gaa1-domain-containing protein n=1 Tax=Russula earlei TaxID=71964 RepID=A0ACC0U9B6_9AGAM|nr:Gaa1-domain-containing protein [Russula earlei]
MSSSESPSRQAPTPPHGLGRLRHNIKKSLLPGDNATRIRTRRRIVAFAWRYLDMLRLCLLSAGCLWLLTLPVSQLGVDTYIDENALQPSQVNTYWNWVDVHRADRLLEDVSLLRERNLSSVERATFFATEFAKCGLPSSTQTYSIQTSHGTLNGTNAYAVFSAPRTSGTEAMIISASWKSMTGGENLRGVSIVLSLAAFLKQYSHWSKDIIFVITDNHLDGMHAWLGAYHRPSSANWDAEPLSITSGVVWTALNIDYPGHSFSHLGVFREGLNGRLPNQDLINSFRTISQQTSGVPVLLYDHYEPSEFPGREGIRSFYPSWLPNWLWERETILEYGYRAKNILRHFAYQARGRASGPHGSFHQYRIDAITLFAVPSNGPHGFYALGRAVESTLRTMSNLLERLHASFFFYIMTTPSTFLKIGSYLPSAVLVAAALMIGGLREWVKAGWVELEECQSGPGKGDAADIPSSSKKKWAPRRRDLLDVFVVMAASHLVGLTLFVIICREWLDIGLLSFIILPACWVVLMLAPWKSPSLDSSVSTAPLHTLLKAINMCLASTLISVSSVLNFSLAALLAVTLGVPLSSASPSDSLPERGIKCALYTTLAFGWLAFHGEVKQGIWDWEVLGVWFSPLVCLVYVPLVLQAGIISSLSP